MAEYDFECRKCKKTFLLFMRITERMNTSVRCPDCGSEDATVTGVLRENREEELSEKLVPNWTSAANDLMIQVRRFADEKAHREQAPATMKSTWPAVPPRRHGWLRRSAVLC